MQEHPDLQLSPTDQYGLGQDVVLLQLDLSPKVDSNALESDLILI